MKSTWWGKPEHMVAIVLVFAGLVAVCGTPIAAAAQTAPTTLIDGEETLWQLADGDYVLSTPVIAGELVATARDVLGDEPTLIVFDRQTGSTVWSWHAPADTWISTSPVIDGQTLYLATAPNDQYGGTLYAFDVRTGGVRWTVSTDQSIAVDPVVAEDTIYIQAGELLALDVATGDTRWRYAPQTILTSPPLVSDSLVFVGDFGGALAAVERSTGQARWRVAPTATPAASLMAKPAMRDGVVFVGSDAGALEALAADDGSVIWQTTVGVGQPIRNPPLPIGESVIVASTYTLAAMSAETGDVRWRQEIAGGSLALVQTGETVVLASSGDASDVGTLTGYALTDGHELWQLTNQGSLLSTPAIHDGVIYVGSADSFSAVRLPNTSPATP